MPSHDTNMASVDPWNWSVDEVVVKIAAVTPLHRRKQVESFLRQNAVDGTVLLQHLQSEDIYNEFDDDDTLASAILGTVRKLQRISSHYAQHRLTLPSLRARLCRQVQFPSPVTSPQVRQIGPLEEPVVPHHVIPPEPKMSSNRSKPEDALVPQRPIHLSAVASPQVPTTQGQQQIFNTENQQYGSTLMEPRHRDGEELILGADGSLKRRKLNLVALDRAAVWQLNPNTLFSRPDAPNFEEDAASDSSDNFSFVIAKPSRHKEHSREVQAVRNVLKNNLRRCKAFAVQQSRRRHRQDYITVKSSEDKISLPAVLSDDSDFADNHDWDYLLDKYHEGGQDLPCYGESGSENNFSDACLDEMDEETQQTRPASQLSEQQILAAIDEFVGSLEIKWKEEKLLIRENKAWSIWRKGYRDRSAVIQGARLRLHHLERRLDKLKRDIAGVEWSSHKQLQRQCAVLDVTVFERLDELWKIQLWRSAKPPPRPTKIARPTRVRTAPIQLDSASDGEDVESDSDSFIDDDDDDNEDERQDANKQVQLPRSMTPTRMPELEAPHTPQTTFSVVNNNGIPLSAFPSTSSIDTDTEMVGEVSNIVSPASLDIVVRQTSRTAMVNDTAEVSDYDSSSPLARHEPPRRVSETIEIDSDPPSPPVIDLTNSPPRSLRRSASPGSTDGQALPLSSVRVWDDAPEEASKSEIASWNWAELEGNHDRKRTIIKIIHEMRPRHWNRMKESTLTTTVGTLAYDLMRALSAMMQDHSKRKAALPSLSDLDVWRALTMAKLYLCWTFCDHTYWSTDIIDFPTKDTAAQGTDKHGFCRFVQRMFKRKMKRVATVSESSEDDSLSEEHAKPGKRKVKIDRSAEQQRTAALQRQAAGEENKKKLVLNMGSSFASETGTVMINTATTDATPIFINKYISGQIKPHQIDGVQFLWRELITPGSNAQGCLLAHTMGLGKTMQV